MHSLRGQDPLGSARPLGGTDGTSGPCWVLEGAAFGSVSVLAHSDISLRLTSYEMNAFQILAHLSTTFNPRPYNKCRISHDSIDFTSALALSTLGCTFRPKLIRSPQTTTEHTMQASPRANGTTIPVKMSLSPRKYFHRPNIDLIQQWVRHCQGHRDPNGHLCT